jgi:hypothetical protein
MVVQVAFSVQMGGSASAATSFLTGKIAGAWTKDANPVPMRKAIFLKA